MTLEELLKETPPMQIHAVVKGFQAGAASRDAEIAELRQQLETECMRLVACGVVAMADTPDSAKQARDMHPDYMSASCSNVARRVDECINLRRKLVEWSNGERQYPPLVEDMQELSRQVVALKWDVAERDAQIKLLLDAVSYSKHQCEGMRVWGGMSWTYHPFQAKRIFDVCEKAMADTAPTAPGAS